MENDFGYSYMDEERVDPCLKCNFCTKPFVDPVKMSDEERLCKKCAYQKLMQNNNLYDENSIHNQYDPSSDTLPLVTDITVLKMLNEILVRCVECGEMNIERGKFTEHKNTVCSKSIVSCSAADLKCPWNGKREQLDEHLTKCSFESMRPVLEQQKNQYEDLEKQFRKWYDNQNKQNEEYQSRICELETTNSSYVLKIDLLQKEVKLLMEQQSAQSKIFQDDIQQIKINDKDQSTRYDKLTEEVAQLEKKVCEHQPQIAQIQSISETQGRETKRVDDLCKQSELQIKNHRAIDIYLFSK